MASDSRFQNLRALLVEPSAVQARIIRAECDEIGLHQVETVGTVADALDAMLRRAPDLTLSALYLPDGSGTELVEAMRAEGRLAEVPFLLISSETRPQALEPVRQSGACGILPKPFTAAQLSRAIGRTLDLLSTSTALEKGYDRDEGKICTHPLEVNVLTGKKIYKNYVYRIYLVFRRQGWSLAERGYVRGESRM